ncbi:helix-turn-helix transcriptional regulator [Azospirillum sp. A26]|jgi:transcriptional regulator with XRE-family HTH domain
MKRPVLLSSPEADALERLGRRIRLARLRRNLSQDEMSVRTGVTKKTYIALEKGKETVNVGLLVKVMSVLGYADRLPDMLASDPLGEELEEIHGRKRGGHLEG